MKLSDQKYEETQQYAHNQVKKLNPRLKSENPIAEDESKGTVGETEEEEEEEEEEGLRLIAAARTETITTTMNTHPRETVLDMIETVFLRSDSKEFDKSNLGWEKQK
ncbi:hypothetical protein HYC85_014946 [Camellia sinensis]|uniref:Uncharacterized protein n=1 Tax=Camellia sinensis TaxID=4442 RepID=A0A7J7H7Z5_CAMSI|nr:hypothetical protein HYC85_014946 [Camellia sinensis]